MLDISERVLVLFTAIPARRPSSENMNDAHITRRKAHSESETSGAMRWPTSIIIVQLIRARITPDKVFPITTDAMCIGQRSISSKLI